MSHYQNLAEKQSTILVVEDSPTQAMHIQNMLEQNGAHVLVAVDGLEGIRLAEGEQPDLVVLDMQLPDMNGLQVCKQLKSNMTTDQIPVIMFTRYDDAETIALGLQLGVIDYIPKDAFADAVLLETLRQMNLLAPRQPH